MRRIAGCAKSLLRASQQSSVVTEQLAFAARAFSSYERRTATLFPGDGIGPEIAQAVQEIFAAAHVPIDWDIQRVSQTVDPRTNSMITRENLDSVLVIP